MFFAFWLRALTAAPPIVPTRPCGRSVSTAFDPAFQTCNIFYPRAILERVGGFDIEAFGRVHGGEDSDLAWRAIKSGAAAVFADGALVHHAVNELGPAGSQTRIRRSTPARITRPSGVVAAE